MKFKFTVVVLSYNSSRFLIKTLFSIYLQRFKNYEVIIIDDGSKDNTHQLLKLFSLFPNTRVLIDGRNFGISKRINQAAGMSNAEWILFLGHDDLISPLHLQKMVGELSSAISLVHCNSYLINEKDEIIGLSRSDDKQISKSKQPLHNLSKHNFISSCGLIMNKEKFMEVGGWNEKYKNFGEWLLWIKLSKVGKISYTNKIKAYYRKHESSTIKSMKALSKVGELEKYQQHCRQRAHTLSDPGIWSKIRFIIQESFYQFRYQILALANKVAQFT